MPWQSHVTGCHIKAFTQEFWSGVMGLIGHPLMIRQVEGFRQPLSHWAGSLLVENLCISIPGKRDMMMTPMDFYASITPDCNKFGVSGQAAPCYCPGFWWKFMEQRIDQTSNKNRFPRPWLESMWLSQKPRWQQVSWIISYKYSHLYWTHQVIIEQ